MSWYFEVDVVVVGAGAGGLTAAFVTGTEGLQTVVVESTDKVGGTAAYSAGALWFPGSIVAEREELDDSIEVALDYYRRIVGDTAPVELQSAFVMGGAKVVEYLEKSPHIQFSGLIYPDYYGDIGCPPAHARGRDVVMAPLEMSELGALRDQMRFSMANDVTGAAEADMLDGGRALIGRLLLSVSDLKNVDIRMNTALADLIVEDGRVAGIVAISRGKTIRIGARKGVLLSAGGFERNQAMRDQYGVVGSADWSAGAPGGTGTAISAAMDIGADTGLMSEMWFMPGLLQPSGRSGFIPAVNGGIIVNGDGNRFANETQPYDRFGRAMAGDKSANRGSFWWIWDARFGPTIPSVYNSLPVLDFEAYAAAGLWKRADTLQSLAKEIGVPADSLIETVARYNRFAQTGDDEDFQRGQTPYDRYIAMELPYAFGLQDSTPVGTPNPCLIPLEGGPYYAARIVVGDLGTKGGLKTDIVGRVLGKNGKAITGLFAAGNTMASSSGATYPAPGTPIGNSMVFSFLAAATMANVATR